MNIKIVVLSLLTLACVCYAGPSEAPLKVTLHDSHGLSIASAPNKRLELVLFAEHTHLHLRISNTTNQTMTFWKPYCPQGDDAIVVKFREPAHPQKVLRASTGWSYTGGMGIPKVFELVGHDDLIVNINFISGMVWILPMQIPKDARLDMEVRVGYRSRNLTADELKRSGATPVKVWEGEVLSDWQPITSLNRTGKAFDRKAP
jgi:hypothetical protein